ncbi:OsmC family protein [Dawidia soli]|uniref:OsmC family protein n=1 Tax=Dawidia soli TaxID=2782352 RepID=A0AAP2DF00_9BACT|nr:OsmC family protein [Dawidia soli]MBT1689921.1 OsmC family protein [Dawidia soli]
MKITAKLENHFNYHAVTVETDGVARDVSIPGKVAGFGSAVNGGELLCLALATCFCNDLYREAHRQALVIRRVTVEASAEFRAEGQPGYNFQYKVHAEGDATDEQIDALIRHTDTVSEIQNTLRRGSSVVLVDG